MIDHLKTGFKTRPKYYEYAAFRAAHKPADDTPQLRRERNRLKERAKTENKRWTALDTAYTQHARVIYNWSVAQGLSHDDACRRVQEQVPDPRRDPAAAAFAMGKVETAEQRHLRLLQAADIDPDAYAPGDKSPEAKAIRRGLRQDRRDQKRIKDAIERDKRMLQRLEEQKARSAQRDQLRALGGPARRAALIALDREAQRLRRVSKRLELPREAQHTDDLCVCLKVGRPRRGPQWPVHVAFTRGGVPYVPRLDMR